MSGHPGSTERNLTLVQLETDRDVIYPTRIARYKRELQALRALRHDPPADWSREIFERLTDAIAAALVSAYRRRRELDGDEERDG